MHSFHTRTVSHHRVSESHESGFGTEIVARDCGTHSWLGSDRSVHSCIRQTGNATDFHILQ